MNETSLPTRTCVSECPPPPANEVLELGQMLGQRRATASMAAHCSAAHAGVLRRIRDEKLYLPLAASWSRFCERYLTISRRHADRIIALLNRFGPAYFEIAELTGISPADYEGIEPAVREGRLLLDGESIGIVPENAQEISGAIQRAIRKRRARERKPVGTEQIERMARQCRRLAQRLLDLRATADAPELRVVLLAIADLRAILE